MQFLIEGRSDLPGGSFEGYLRCLEGLVSAEEAERTAFEAPYFDVLQVRGARLAVCIFRMRSYAYPNAREDSRVGLVLTFEFRAACAAQSPLQPLMDNLESATYETFERDSHKYSQYELAMAAALSDHAAGALVVIMVVRRGPL